MVTMSSDQQQSRDNIYIFYPLKYYLLMQITITQTALRLFIALRMKINLCPGLVHRTVRFSVFTVNAVFHLDFLVILKLI